MTSDFTSILYITDPPRATEIIFQTACTSNVHAVARHRVKYCHYPAGIQQNMTPTLWGEQEARDVNNTAHEAVKATHTFF